MTAIRKFIRTIWWVVFIGWLLFLLEQYCERAANSSGGSWIGHVIAPLMVIILAIPVLLYIKVLHLPTDINFIVLITIACWGLNFLILYFEKAEEIRQAREREEQLKMVEEQERKRKAEQAQKEAEISKREKIVNDIKNILYKEVGKEVNKTLIPTLLNELYDIYLGLNSENINDLIINGSVTDFENIINSIKSELNRLKKLALDAQTRGFTEDEKEYSASDNTNGTMTKEKAFQIFGINTNSSKEDIKKAYRELAKKYNTDQRSNYEEHIKELLVEKMKELNSAKDYLTTLGLYG